MASPTVTSGDETEPGGATLYLAAAELPHGTRVDRYLVLSKLGAGGMGVVYDAYDPELDRRIALKLVRDGDEPSARSRHERLLREARTMAQLEHPNVIRVYDAGTTPVDNREGVFVAMELVRGQRMGAWCRHRPQREILRALVAAGRGLAAAHAEGIVHRDFKPDNVLVDGAGHVRVGDFGIAAADGEAAPPRIGTPAFMPPEQQRGEVVDASGDQFAFCVTAWCLLFDETPGPDETSSPRGPAWLVKLLRKGLASDPKERHASLRVLLDAIERQPARRWWSLPALALPVVAVGLWIALRDDASERCATAESRFAGMIDNSTRTALGAQGPLGASTMRALEHRARSLADVSADTCAIRRNGKVSAATVARRELCLDQHRAMLDKVTARLRVAKRDLLVDAPALVEALPASVECTDPTNVSFSLELPEDPALRSVVSEASTQLALAHAFVEVGRFTDADELLSQVPAAARAYQPFAAEVALARADLESTRGDSDKGFYDEAIRIGTATSHASVALRAILDQAWDLEPAQAKRSYNLADGWLTRLGDPLELRAHFFGNRSAMFGQLGDHAASIADAQRALALRRERDGESAITTIKATATLASALQVGGRNGEARSLFMETLRASENLLDPDHATIRRIRNNLSDLHMQAGDFAAARAQYEQLLASRRRIYGDEHAEDFDMQRKYASILIGGGAEAEAIPILERALVKAGTSPTAKLGIHQMLTVAHSRRDEHERAIAYAEASIDDVRGLGVGHPAGVSVQTQLAYVLYRAGQMLRANTAARSAVALASSALPPDSPGAANPHNVLALVECARHEYAAAKTHAERAIVLAGDARPDVHAEAELALACALAGLGARSEAIAAGERSVALYEKLGQGAAPERAIAETWLQTQRSAR
jgi:tetratricopeptide (TPR) repeat protein